MKCFNCKKEACCMKINTNRGLLIFYCRECWEKEMAGVFGGSGYDRYKSSLSKEKMKKVQRCKNCNKEISQGCSLCRNCYLNSEIRARTWR